MSHQTKRYAEYKQMRLRIIWLLIVLGVALVVAVVTVKFSDHSLAVTPSRPNTPSPAGVTYLPKGAVMTVNSDPVDSREYLLQMETDEAQVFQYYYDRYGVKDSPNFWNTRRSGTTPLATLKKLTIQQIVQRTVQLQMARERGMIKNISYASVTANLKRVNKERASALAQHLAVYGPLSFTERTYFSYITGNLRADLALSLENSMERPSTAVLEHLYTTLRNDEFSCPTMVRGRSVIREPATNLQDCTSGEKYLPFTAVEPQVLHEWKQNQVGALIEARVIAAKVVINNHVYDKIVAGWGLLSV